MKDQTVRGRLGERTQLIAVLVVPAVLVLLLSACGGASLPASVVQGSEVSVAWTGQLTSTNPATLAGATSGNLDVSALTRGRFAEAVGGKVQQDTAFGKVRVVSQKPFRVRYDLAEPAWSDGVPVDAADLALAWLAGSHGRAGFEATPSGLAQSTKLVKVDEGSRSIEVEFSQPVPDWATALDVAVPAHVVGAMALGLDDPMEAKKAVIDAAQKGSGNRVNELATAWTKGFAVHTGREPAARVLLSNGPYRVQRIVEGKFGQRVDLVANSAYVGALKPSLEKISLLQMAEADALTAVQKHQGGVDIAELPVTSASQEPLHQLERRDYRVTTVNDGTLWVLALRTRQGVFTRPAARAAFLGAVPRNDLRESGVPGWPDAFAGSDSLVFAPNSAGYEISLEDSGFGTRFAGDGKGTEQIVAAGVAPGTAVCVAYDKDSEFARGAFSELAQGMSAAGWAITDCGAIGFVDAAKAPARADAVLVRIPVPESPAQLAQRWGSGDGSLTGAANPGRDALITQLATTTDPYQTRDLRAQIDKSLVDDAVALPIAMNPVLVVAAPRISGVTPRSGAFGLLTSGASEWTLLRN